MEKSRDEDNQYKGIIENIAHTLGLDVPRVSGESLQMCCPFHKESNPSFGINMTTGAYHCFACGSKGHIKNFSNALRSHIVAEHIDNIREFEVLAQVDTESYAVKPSRYEFGTINDRISMQPFKKYTVDDLMTLLINGRTVSPSGAKENNQWKMQQMIMLDFDFDNMYQGTTRDDVIQYAKRIGLEPTFSYYTYSSTDDVPRFRFVYCFKEPITDGATMKAIISNMFNKFETYAVDEQCSDFRRMFAGTVFKDVYVSNLIYSTRFTSEQLSKIDDLFADNISSNDDVFRVGGKFKHYLFGQYMIDKYHIVRLNKNQLHLYQDGIYLNNNEEHIIEDICQDTVDELFNKNVDEVMGYISRKSKKTIESEYNFIAFKNGILNIITMEFIPFTPDIVITSRVNAEYAPYDSSMTNPTVDKYFDDVTCHDMELEIFLYAIIIYCLCRTNMFHLSFIMKRWRWKWKEYLF